MDSPIIVQLLHKTQFELEIDVSNNLVLVKRKCVSSFPMKIQGLTPTMCLQTELKGKK